MGSGADSIFWLLTNAHKMCILIEKFAGFSLEMKLGFGVTAKYLQGKNRYLEHTLLSDDKKAVMVKKSAWPLDPPGLCDLTSGCCSGQ